MTYSLFPNNLFILIFKNVEIRTASLALGHWLKTYVRFCPLEVKFYWITSQLLSSPCKNYNGFYFFFSLSFPASEQGQNISLTVVRANGTFGTVSLFYYTQSISGSVLKGTDFLLEDGVSFSFLSFFQRNQLH